MPDSVFLQQVRARPEKTLAERAREELIDSCATRSDYLPRVASTCYVWPSPTCPVGCGHCNFASPVQAPPSRRTILGDPDRAIRLVSEMGAWKVVLSGGGEPMVAPEFCRKFVREVQSDGLEEIELITSAHFAETEDAARNELRHLRNAWRQREDREQVRFTVRLSLDWFHAQRLGVAHTATMISVMGEPEFSDIGCYVRSVLLENDHTVEDLARILRAELGDLTDFQQHLHLPDGRQILVYYKNLIIDGRMTSRKLGRLPVGISTDASAAEFGKRFLAEDGKQVPARTYNGPTVQQLDGLACVLEDDGTLKILEGIHPARGINMFDVTGWETALSYLIEDPLTLFLSSEGPSALAELISDRYPDSLDHIVESNQLYYLTDRLLESTEVSLYATLKAIGFLGSEAVRCSDLDLNRAWHTYTKLADSGAPADDGRRP